MTQILENVFPAENNIPEQFQISQRIEQREYLINGVLKRWEGNLNPVLSPVFVKEGNGYKQKIIGDTPLLTSNEAMEALDAAVKAYDLGHGLWPTMSVTDRITHVENNCKAAGRAAGDVALHSRSPPGFRRRKIG